MQYCNDPSEKIISFANSIKTIEGEVMKLVLKPVYLMFLMSMLRNETFLKLKIKNYNHQM